jgi:hypothetical protein
MKLSLWTLQDEKQGEEEEFTRSLNTKISNGIFVILF